MRFLFLICLLFVAAGVASGDTVIVQQVNGMAQTGQMTIMVNSNKVRADVSPQMSTITDVATGDVTMLMHAQKAYIVISAAAGKALLAGTSAVTAQASPGTSGTSGTTGALLPPLHPPSAHDTGKMQKINGYNASEYTFTNGNLKATYWISKDVPNGKLVTDAMAKFQKGSLASIAACIGPDMSAFPGVPVKTEVDLNGQKITTVLVSATEQAVDPAEYQVPAGYAEMKMPGVDGD
jgi:hypothetical protein